ncbi:MAG: cobalamin biosynthesis protein, partial [Thaumarchaeota archaeon]|nr:cobalamin biosynthesis protein [Nitrososphaerota archaeon]
MILVPILAVIFAIAIDLLLGDPKNKFHPTAWIGRLIGKIVPLGKNHSAKIEKICGIVIVVSITSFVCVALYFLTFELENLKSQIQSNTPLELIFTFFSVVITSLLLKTTIAIKGMEEHAKKIIQALSIGALNDART